MRYVAESSPGLRFGSSKKAPWGVFFILGACLCLVSWGALGAICEQSGVLLSRDYGAEPVVLEKVLDGDTVLLADGRKIRVIGVNTPELARENRPVEPLAQEATDALEGFLGRGSKLFLVVGESPKDRYGRTLGHLFTDNGQNVTKYLLEKGLGFQVAIPPNLQFADCYYDAQTRARKEQLGVWGNDYFEPVYATDSKRLRGGYLRIIGQVDRISDSKCCVWVMLKGDVVLRVSRKDLPGLEESLLHRLSARPHGLTGWVEVKGWVQDRLLWSGSMGEAVKRGTRKRWQLHLRSSFDWREE